MSAELLLAAINEMDVKASDSDTLEGLTKSLEHILENDNFNGLTQEAAFCKLTEIREVLGTRSALIENKKAKLEEALAAAEVEAAKDSEVPAGSNPTEQLIRCIIRSEEDGTHSFEFRGIRWNWNPEQNAWNFTKPEEPNKLDYE